jgi:glycosyltransferase involved in cell wall biosynthesis
MIKLKHATKPRLLIVANIASFLVSHRIPIAIAALNNGYEVHIATAIDHDLDRISIEGVTHHAIPISRSGQNPLSELNTFWSIFALFRHIKPDIVHVVTVKPVLYGGIAARIARMPRMVFAISGLGFVFADNGVRARITRIIISCLYKWALGHKSHRVIVQNMSDKEVIQKLTKLDDSRFSLIPGSGVDMNTYIMVPEPEGDPIVVMASRMLFDKGINEFFTAARILKQSGVRARFVLIGDVDPENPNSASEGTLLEWRNEGSIEWWGYKNNMEEILSRCHLVVLPSYYGEGLPKVLIEAAACGRAVITTDSPGCRDAIENKVTGLLVPIQDAEALAQAIRGLLENPGKRRAMGLAGRQRAERIFPLEKIIEAHLKIYQNLLQAQ